MRVPSSIVGVLALAPGIWGSTIHLCGDSTMAAGGAGMGTQGWGEYLADSFSGTGMAVKNWAMAGRSARSYTREGRFAAVAAAAREGDWVVIEFGHNDGGGLGRGDNGRADCGGAGAETCQTTYNGVAEVVQTFPTYLKNAAHLMRKAGANVILSAQTPNNVWESGTFAWGPSRFDDYARLAATEMGGTNAWVYYVGHGAYAAQAMKNLGADVVNKNYPNDHVHTSPYLAGVVAKAFVRGLKCGTSDLGKVALSPTDTFLGDCISPAPGAPV